MKSREETIKKINIKTKGVRTMRKKMFLFAMVGTCVIFLTHWVIAQPPEAPGPSPSEPTTQNSPAPAPPPQGMQPPRLGMQEMFKKADANGDGNISWEEFQNMRQNRPPMSPRKQAGQCPNVPEEKEGLQPQGPGGRGNPPEGRPNRMRGDRPRQEGLRQREEEIFNSADKDGDGKLTLEEFKAIRPPRRQMPPEAGGPGTQAPGVPGINKLIKEADRDNDGKVSFDEMKAVRPHITQERFEWLDRNSDSFITEEDIPPHQR